MDWLQQFEAAIAFRGISKAELARRADVSKQQVYRWTRADRSEAPRIDDAIRLAAALDMTLNQAFAPGHPFDDRRILPRLHEGLDAKGLEDDEEAGAAN